MGHTKKKILGEISEPGPVIDRGWTGPSSEYCNHSREWLKRLFGSQLALKYQTSLNLLVFNNCRLKILIYQHFGYQNQDLGLKVDVCRFFDRHCQNWIFLALRDNGDLNNLFSHFLEWLQYCEEGPVQPLSMTGPGSEISPRIIFLSVSYHQGDLVVHQSGRGMVVNWKISWFFS